MRFEDYLLRKQYLTKRDFLELVWQGAKGTVGQTDPRTDFLEPKLLEGTDFAPLMRVPFGDILCQGRNSHLLENVLGRSQSESLDDLVFEWRKFHVDNYEPISEYSLTTEFGKRLHCNIAEKKLCAKFIASSDSFGLTPIIHDGSHVIIPEGSSAFYAGLAIGALRKNITFITSNGAFIRELSENPVLASSARNVYVVGGELDTDPENGNVASRGFIGPSAELDFDRALEKPGATVLVCSVNGLLPQDGPFGPAIPSPKTCMTRLSLLKTAVSRGVRHIVFVCDWSKMLYGSRESYGEPIFTQRNAWQDFLRNHILNISFAIAPPQELSIVPEFAKQAARHRPFQGLDPQIDSAICRDYLKCAKEIDEGISEICLENRFHELFRTTPKTISMH